MDFKKLEPQYINVGFKIGLATDADPDQVIQAIADNINHESILEIELMDNSTEARNKELQ